MRKSVFRAQVAALLVPSALAAQTTVLQFNRALDRAGFDAGGRHQFEVSAGFSRSVGEGSGLGLPSIPGTIDRRNIYGTVAYRYQFQRHLALDVSLGVLGTEAGSSDEIARVVVPVLVGMRYYFGESIRDVLPVRPYLTAALGSYIGIEAADRASVTRLFSETASSEVALGVKVGGGIDYLLGSRLKLALTGGYRAMTDFERALGGRENFSGVEFAIGLGVVFGGVER